MTLAQSFTGLFESVHTVTMCLWITGLVLFCIEFFQPMRGVAYVLGVCLLGAAFSTRVVYGTAGQAFMFIFITATLLFGVHCVSLATQKRDWLRVARIEKADARSERYDKLLDSIGIAYTPIDPVGNVIVNDINIVAHSETPIMQGERVRVTNIASDKITVERV